MMQLSDDELRQLVLLCLRELERHGCQADPAVTSALMKLTEEKRRRDSPPA
jgi:hypothetical protein